MVFIMDHLWKQSALGKEKHDVQIDEDKNNVQGNSTRAGNFDVPHVASSLMFALVIAASRYGTPRNFSINIPVRTVFEENASNIAMSCI
jgi:hypothetical protein